MWIVFKASPNPTSCYAILPDNEEFRVTTNATLDNGVFIPNQVYSHHEPEKAFYHLVKTQAAAEKIASYCASKTPGIEWHTAKLENKFVAHASPVTQTTYTEKGALPK